MLEFDYVDFDPHFNGKLAFDLGEPFLQVSLQNGYAGRWSYFDLDVAQLKALKEFIEGAIEKLEKGGQ
jgi:hypothetical protein